jgi:cytochrome c oxidase subunit 4
MKEHTEGLTFFKVAGALMGLLVLTVAVSFVDLGAFNIPVALIIAAAKAVLVLAFFMELRHTRYLIWIFVAGGTLAFVLLLSGILSDIATRG